MKLEAKEDNVKYDHQHSKKLRQQNDHGNPNEIPDDQDLSLETERVSSSPPVKKNAEEDVSCCIQEIDDDELDLKLLEETDLLDPKDTSFHCSDWADSSLDKSLEENVSKQAEERKFIIFESNLDFLVMRLRCQFVVGTMLKMKVECLDGHTIISWNFQQVLGQIPAGNLLCSAATMFSGETFQHIKNFADFLGLSYVGKSMYFDIQCKILLPIVNEGYNQHIQEVRQELNGKDTFLARDGRFDSPGYSAKYDGPKHQQDSSIKLNHVSEAGSSVASEKAGCVRSLEELEREQFQVDLLVTDCHASIAKFMCERNKEKHEYDIWYVTKSIKTKLFKKV